MPDENMHTAIAFHRLQISKERKELWGHIVRIRKNIRRHKLLIKQIKTANRIHHLSSVVKIPITFVSSSRYVINVNHRKDLTNVKATK